MHRGCDVDHVAAPGFRAGDAVVRALRGTTVFALYAVSAAWLGWELLGHGREAWRYLFDFSIYHESVRALFDGRPLYAPVTPQGLGFTYPPAAISLFVLFGLLPVKVGALLWNLVLLACTAGFLAWLVTRVKRSHAEPVTALAVALAVAIVCLTEPLSDSVWLGQISPLVGYLTIIGVALGSVRGAALVGAAAGVKITPAFALVGLVWRRHGLRLVAAVLGGFALTVLVGFALLPADSRWYWFHGLFDTARVGRLASGSNTSLYGLVAHLGASDAHVERWSLYASVVVVLLACLQARALPDTFDGRLVLGLSLSILSVLVTPVSWSHHAIAVPVALAYLALRGYGAAAALVAVPWVLPVYELAAHRAPGLTQDLLFVARPLTSIAVVVALTALALRGARDEPAQAGEPIENTSTVALR